MQKIRKFNADAFAHTAQHVSRTLCLRRGAERRALATLEAVAQSRALIASTDALFALSATRPGWLWPAYCSGSPDEEDR